MIFLEEHAVRISRNETRSRRNLRVSIYDFLAASGDAALRDVILACRSFVRINKSIFMGFSRLSSSSRSGFMCMAFYRRDGHVIELQTGSSVSRPEEACSPPHFLQHSMPFLTLVSEYNSLFRFLRFSRSSRFAICVSSRKFVLLPV